MPAAMTTKTGLFIIKASCLCQSLIFYSSIILEKPLDNKVGFKARFNCLFCKLKLANLCKTRYTGAAHFFLSKTKNGGSLL